MTDFMTVTKLSTVVYPTTFTSVYVSTDIIDNVRLAISSFRNNNPDFYMHPDQDH